MEISPTLAEPAPMGMPDVPALKPLLLDKLQKATRFSTTAIPLVRAKETTALVYRSAIALKTAAGGDAIRLAEEFAAHLCPTQPTTKGLPLFFYAGDLQFTVEIVPPAWLVFQLTAAGTAIWLQRLTQWQNLAPTVLLSPTADTISPTPSLFAVHYAHARCCSLLASAHRQGLIALHRPAGPIISPHTLPWLFHPDPASPAPLGELSLRLLHPAERALISLLAVVTDQLACPPPGKMENCLPSALAVSEGFDHFYRACRIWGEVMQEQPQLALARLGLVGATQRVLLCLLKNNFGCQTPIEL